MREDQPSSAHKDSVASTFLRFACILPIAFAVYVLSIGPAVKLAEKRVIPTRFLFVFEPMVELADRIPPLRKALAWYTEAVWRCNA